MLLEELIYLFNESAIVVLYNENQDIISVYDGTNSIPEEFGECTVNDIFPDTVAERSAIGIEINTEVELP